MGTDQQSNASSSGGWSNSIGGAGRGFRQCAIGLVFLLDLRFGVDGRSVDLLNDVVAAFLLWWGCARMLDAGLRIGTAHWLASAVGLLGIADLVAGLARASGAVEVIGIATAVVALPLVWILCSLAGQTAAAVRDGHTVSTARRRGVAFVAFNLAAAIIGPVIASSAGEGTRRAFSVTLLVELFFAQLVTLALVVLLMTRAAGLLQGHLPPARPARRIAWVAVVTLALVAPPATVVAALDGGAPPRRGDGFVAYGSRVEDWQLRDAEKRVVCSSDKPCPPFTGKVADNEPECTLNAHLWLANDDWFIVRRGTRVKVSLVGSVGDGRTLRNERGEEYGNFYTFEHEIGTRKVGSWWRAFAKQIAVESTVPCHSGLVNLTMNFSDAERMRLGSDTVRIQIIPGATLIP